MHNTVSGGTAVVVAVVVVSINWGRRYLEPMMGEVEIALRHDGVRCSPQL